MKLTKSVKKLALLLLLFCFTIAGCDIFTDIDAERKYDGPSQVAFKFQSSTVDEGSGTYSLEVQIIRGKLGKLDQALPVNFVVVDSLTTATDSDYDILTPSPVTIPADSLRTYIQVDINGTGIADGSSRDLVLKLTGNESENVKGAEEIGLYEFLIVGVDESDT